jgi:chromosome partitioning protein
LHDIENQCWLRHQRISAYSVVGTADSSDPKIQLYSGASMSIEKAIPACPARVIVVGNEKGGSGKSTVAMHVAVALLKAGQSVATIDLDSPQRSLTHYVENRRAWARHVGRDLETPEHICLSDAPAGDQAGVCEAFADALDRLAQTCGFIVIDTAGRGSDLMRLAHSAADTLITPLNDSFVDFDVLGTVDPETFTVTGASHYSEMIEQVRRQRRLAGHGSIDWIVLRNRLSMLGTRNKRLVGAALQDLARRLEFRAIEGLAERMIFREFYPRGLTALDDLDETTLGTRPTLSHATARQEVANLLQSISLVSNKTPMVVTGDAAAHDRDAA